MDSQNYTNSTLQNELESCGLQSSSIVAAYSLFLMNVLVIIVGCKVCHLVLSRLGQPRIISEFIVGLAVGNVSFFYSGVKGPVVHAFKRIETIASSTYMFVLGLEMEPLSILQPPGPEASMAYSSILSTSIITFLTYFLINHRGLQITFRHSPRVIASFAIVLSTTSSPILTRLTTELKIGKSEIGRLAIRTGLANDMVCTLIVCFIFILRGFRNSADATSGEVIILLVFLAAELLFVVKVVRPFLGWLNDRNPEGKPIKGIDMAATVATMLIMCHISFLYGYDIKMNSFLVGLAMPREGRMSNFLISKVNYALTSFILPLYLSTAGLKTNLDMWSHDVDEHGNPSGGHSMRSWYRLAVISTIATVGKLSGTLVAGMHHGLHWLEAITLGVLLNIKGYFHIFLVFQAKRAKVIGDSAVLVMMFAVMVSIVFVPGVVSLIVRHVRKKAGQPQLMGLQWHNPESELRMMVGLHGPQNVPAAVNLIEMLRGGAAAGLAVYTVDMIELTERAAATLVHSHGTEAVTLTEETIVEMRDQIGAALEAYTWESGEAGLRLRRILAISSFSDMHEDICCGAQDSLAVLIVLPFDKTQRVDGGMDAGNPGFRIVNQKVIQHASCSVGILVDRGLGRANNVSVSNASQNVAVVFIGGADDREALAYAGYISQHPAIRLMVIRFLPDAEAMAMITGHGRRILTAVTQQEMEMKVDDEYFAGFYQHHVAYRGVGYMEKHVANGAEAVATLRALEGEYKLFIVGRGRERDSVLTAGMSEWAECPELGPIGDILASSDFSVTASVLVIQQHDHARDPELISDEFMPL